MITTYKTSKKYLKIIALGLLSAFAITIPIIALIQLNDTRQVQALDTIDNFHLIANAQDIHNQIKHIIINKDDAPYSTESLLIDFNTHKAHLNHVLPLLYLPRGSEDALIQQSDNTIDELNSSVEETLISTEKYLKKDQVSLADKQIIDKNNKKTDRLFSDLFSIQHRYANDVSSENTKQLNKEANRIFLVLTITFFSIILLACLLLKRSTQQLNAITRSINSLSLGETEENIPFIDQDNNIGDIAKAASIFRTNLLELQNTHKELNYNANHDILTGTGNRRYLASYFESIKNKRDISLFVIDLDEFKYINDYYGSAAGDKILKKTAQAIAQLLEEDDFLARVGGNEFIVLKKFSPRLEKNEDTVEIFSEKLIRSINEITFDKEKKIYVSVNIGISHYPDDGKLLETLTSNASTALSHVKLNKRNSYLQINSELKHQALVSKDIVKELHSALKNDEITVFYQPQVDTHSRKIISFEALVRWNHATKGLLTPDEFIHEVSSTALIEKIGVYILEQSILALTHWDSLGLPETNISINLSMRELSNPNLYDNIIKQLSQCPIDSSRIEFEVLETVAIQDNNQFILKNLQRLYEYGINLNIDDFGIGYSSISSLQKSQFSKIKIDQSFVCSEKDEHKHKVLLRSMIVLAESLQIKSLVEGIETEEQLALVKAYGCDQIQGFLICKPKGLDEISDWWMKRLENKSGG